MGMGWLKAQELETILSKISFKIAVIRLKWLNGVLSQLKLNYMYIVFSYDLNWGNIPSRNKRLK